MGLGRGMRNANMVMRVAFASLRKLMSVLLGRSWQHAGMPHLLEKGILMAAKFWRVCGIILAAISSAGCLYFESGILTAATPGALICARLACIWCLVVGYLAVVVVRYSR